MTVDWDAAIAQALKEVRYDEDWPNRATLSELVETYFVHHVMADDPEETRRNIERAQETGVFELGKTRPAADPFFWAWEVVERLVEKLPKSDALDLILSLIEFASDDDAIGYVAAGPLEDFILAGGSEALSVIELEAIRSPKLRRALAGVWLPDGPIADRIRELADPLD